MADLERVAGTLAVLLRPHLGQHDRVGGEGLDHRRRHGALVDRARACGVAHRRDGERGKRRLGHLGRSDLRRLGGSRAHLVHRAHELAHGRRGVGPAGRPRGLPAARVGLPQQDGDVLLRLLGPACGLVGGERRRAWRGRWLLDSAITPRTAARRASACADAADVSLASIESTGAPRAIDARTDWAESSTAPCGASAARAPAGPAAGPVAAPPPPPASLARLQAAARPRAPSHSRCSEALAPSEAHTPEVAGAGSVTCAVEAALSDALVRLQA